MKEIPTFNDDMWSYDGLAALDRHSRKSYEATFRYILSQIGVKNFPELVDKKATELGREIRILDLFGGAYFLEDLKNVSKIIGVRLQNNDTEFFKEQFQIAKHLKKYNEAESKLDILSNLIHDPKRQIIEGNLYMGETWRDISKENTESGDAGFDIIVCRPEGPFGNSDAKNIKDIVDGALSREEIYVSLLERATKLMSAEGGLLFTQIPELGTHPEIYNEFWKKYIPKKENSGYEFLLGQGRIIPSRDAFAMKRNSNDTIK